MIDAFSIDRSVDRACVRAGDMAAVVPDGKLTKRIYEWIRDGLYDLAIPVLQEALQRHPSSRGMLSVLAHCLYAVEEFAEAAETYRRLMQLCPDNQDYRVYGAQSLHKAGCDYEEVLSVLHGVSEDHEAGQQLRMALAFELDDLQEFKNALQRQPDDAPQKLFNQACLHYKEGELEKAQQLFNDALEISGVFDPEVAYNCALCSYELQEIGPALQYLSAIIDRGIAQVTAADDGTSRSVRDSFLIEALSLKIAIEIQLQNTEAAEAAMRSLPSRQEHDLDPVTLYHSAILHWQDDPEGAVDKLRHLIENPPFPSEAVEALLLLYVQPDLGLSDAASEFMDAFPDLVAQHLSQEKRTYVEAMLLRETAPDKFLEQLQALAVKLRKQIQNLTLRDDQKIRSVTQRHRLKTELENYISVLMAMGHLQYEQGNFGAVEALLMQAEDICKDQSVWTTNLAHVFFVQGTRYEDAIESYKQIIQSSSHLLDVTPVILANLCVSYIMTNQMELAEDLMRRVETEEADQANASDDAPLHLCIINLVIGTLYCSKGNFDFGMARVIKSFDPIETKLDSDTWYYAKKCFLSLLQHLTKHLTQLSDHRLDQIVEFLHAVESTAAESPSGSTKDSNGAEKTISQEASAIKSHFLSLIEEMCTPGLNKE